MGTRLPSTTSLRVFDAAARHLSFTRAAIELNMTQTAVSHQIRNLEEGLGTRLFDRSGNVVALTAAAEAYLQSVRPALAELAAATDRLAEQSDENVLTVQCLGTFAIKRLLPILPTFRRRHPSIALRLTTVQSFGAYFPHEFDLAIWHGTGGWHGVDACKLGDEEVFPVCSPQYGVDAALRHPRDLIGKTLIRTISPILSDEWPFWLDHAGLRDAGLEAEITCDFLVSAMQAAADGLGIALARSTVVGGDLAAGRLIEPFSIRAPSNTAYYLVTPTRAPRPRKVEQFRRWLLAELSRAAP